MCAYYVTLLCYNMHLCMLQAELLDPRACTHTLHTRTAINCANITYMLN
jgi:hypothetical protein